MLTAVECVFVGVVEEEEANVRRICEVGRGLWPFVRVADGAGVRGRHSRRRDLYLRRQGGARVFRHLGGKLRVLQWSAPPSLHVLLPVVSRGALWGAAPGGGRGRRALYGDARRRNGVYHPLVRGVHGRDHAPCGGAEVRQLRSRPPASLLLAR